MDGPYQVDALGHGRRGWRDKSSGPPLLKASLKVKGISHITKAPGLLSPLVKGLNARGP